MRRPEKVIDFLSHLREKLIIKKYVLNLQSAIYQNIESSCFDVETHNSA